MALFKKKPVVIEAHQFDGSYDNAEMIIKWSGGRVTGIFDEDSTPYLMIDTAEGHMQALVGDWIIKGVAHEFYPCKPDVFGFSYELVTDDRDAI
jgi:hypothetical protein